MAIAGVLAMEPEVIILDEPTAGLDPQGVSDIMHLLTELRDGLGMTILIATHDMDIVPLYCDYAYLLSGGRVILEGRPEELFAQPEELRKNHLRLPRIAHLMEILRERDGLDTTPTAATISAARPKIANYHFTTLVPTLGVVSVGEGASFVCADIPGLIEGASEGVGLGHDFLRHVERCRLLLHVVDVSGSECRDPIDDFEKINQELERFSPALAGRPQIVVGNKCDLATPEQIEAFRRYIEGRGLTFVPISAATMQGVKALPGLVYNRLKDIPPVPVFAAEYKKPEQKAEGRPFAITRLEAHRWSIDAPWLERILAGSNVDDYESLQFFQRQLGESGILDALVDKGVEENDTILIGDYQFDYIF